MCQVFSYFCAAISPKINDELTQERSLENSFGMDNANPTAPMAFTAAGNIKDGRGDF